MIRRISLGLVLMAAMSAIGCSDMSSSSESGGSSETNSSDNTFAAFNICKEFVKDRLKSPSTAKFRNYFQEDGEVVVTGSGEGPYTVRSTVDAENSFGAKLRNDFSCTVTRNGDKWHLDAINIDGL